MLPAIARSAGSRLGRLARELARWADVPSAVELVSCARGFVAGERAGSRRPMPLAAGAGPPAAGIPPAPGSVGHPSDRTGRGISDRPVPVPLTTSRSTWLLGGGGSAVAGVSAWPFTRFRDVAASRARASKVAWSTNSSAMSPKTRQRAISRL